MLRRGLRTPAALILSACSLAISGAAAGPANAFQNATYQGTVEIDNYSAKEVCTPDGCTWADQASDGTKYALDLRISAPDKIGESVGSTVYRVGGTTVCRGTLRAYNYSTVQGVIFASELRQAASLEGLSGKERKAAVRARAWCHRKRGFRLRAFFRRDLTKSPARRVEVQYSNAGGDRYWLTRKP